jgi:hypothetical protein
VKALSGYITALKAAPKQITGLFKGPKKVKHIAFAAGGAVGTYFLGGMAVSSLLVPTLNKVGAGNLMNNAVAKRVIGGLVPFTLGYIGSKLIKGEVGKSLMVGGAVASLLEIASPGMVAKLLYRVPGVGAPAVATVAAAAPAAAAGPVHGMDGLGGYVDSPSYQGTGGYVDSPSYQGTGGYVDSPSYQGTGDDEGMDDDSLASGELADGYVDSAADYLNSYLTAGSEAPVSAN